MDLRRLGRFVQVAAFGFLAALCSRPAGADEPSSAGAVKPPTSDSMPGLEAFVDGVVSASMAQQKIAGAQVSIVRDGQVLLTKGYGIDSVDPLRNVDPTRSLFRLGSISKTFTWIAMMQLAEQGRLKLIDPVSVHLPDELDIPDDGFQQPIRILDLMNHTAGFEDTLQHLFVAEGASLAPLAEQLRRYRPHRVREPGKLMAYSNYGVALAGAIVAQVSGMDFESYVEQNILAPLGMKSTTFREEYAPAAGLPAPMPAGLAAHKAQNIEWRDGAWKSVPHEHIVSLAPAGAAVSTAADMAQYMMALLDPGRLERSGVLNAGTFAQMKEPTFQPAPGMPAMHHGFFNAPLGMSTTLGFDNLSHGGATLHFMSFMVVIPDLSSPPRVIEAASAAGPVPLVEESRGDGSLGIFVTTNSKSGIQLVQALPERIVAKYFPPADADALVPPEGARERLREYAGRYRTARRSYTKFEAILSLPAVVPIAVTPDGYLLGRLGQQSARFVEIGEDLFRRERGDMTLAFLRDESGSVTHMLTGGGAFERIGLFGSLPWMLLILAAALITSIGITVAAILRRKRGSAKPATASGSEAAAESPMETPWARRSARLMTGIAVAWLAFIAVCIAWAAPLLGPDTQDRFVYGYPQTSLKIALTILLVAAGLTLLAIVSLVPAWKERSWSMWRRVRHSVAVVVLVALVLTLLQWNAVGFRYF